MSDQIKSRVSEVFVDLLIDSLPAESMPLGPLELVSLTWEQRSRPRRRCFTSEGTEIALALPRGSVLTDGMLVHNTVKRTIQVKAAPEAVLVVQPVSQLEMCIVAHHLGNWHRSLQLEADGSLVIEVDEPLVKWLEHRGISYKQEQRPFHPNLKGSAHG